MEHQDYSCPIRRWDILKRELMNLSADAFLRKLSSLTDYTLLDVRTPAEYKAGTLPHAVNLDFLGDDFWDAFEALDKTRLILIFCRSGRRSVRTAIFMKNGSFREVYNLDGGLNHLLAQFPDALVCPQG